MEVCCIALGCPKGRSANHQFCRWHFGKLGQDLRAEVALGTTGSVHRAVTQLGISDGYLAAVPDRPVVLGEAGTTREWV
jgi:hypothetical protein